MAKERLDKLLVDRGIAQSRERAKGLILAGSVLVGGKVVDKVGTLIDPLAEIALKGEDIPFVSRGGLKLQGALDAFSLDVVGMTAIDVGASTGGFTDCLLQRGASKVYAVDVGYGQLDWRLRQDGRVVNMERTNIRNLTPAELGELPVLAVIDASFISLRKVLPPTLALLAPVSRIVALIKPQFEVGKGEVGKGGIVRDPEQHRRVVEEIEMLATELGLVSRGVIDSPVLGTKGNKEFLILLERGEHG